jgi:hypothetical protein
VGLQDQRKTKANRIRGFASEDGLPAAKELPLLSRVIPGSLTPVEF